MLGELASAVHEGRVSATELVRLASERIDRLNADLNAVILVRDEGLRDAEEMDARIAAGEQVSKLPLAGLPLLVKDNEDCAGLPTTFGSLLRAGAPSAGADCETVARLRAAGAIVVGKTNVPEFAFQGFTANRLFGETRNPWSREWSPGGSSGGSAAAISAGMVPLATGTDGGGSVRIPAAFCGLVGLKPTFGLIGQWPPPSWMELSTKGPLAVSVGDARLLLRIMAGPTPGAPTAPPIWEPPPEPPVRRVLATPRLVAHEASLPAGVLQRFEEALHVLEGATGIAVERIEPPYPPQLDDDWFTMAAIDELTWVGRDVIEAHRDVLTDSFRDAMDAAVRIPIDEYQAARRRRFGYCRETDELLGDDAVLVSPTMCVEGFSPAGGTPERPSTEGNHYNTQPANSTGHPALSVPAGVSDNGVPFGIQVTGPRFRDDLVLSLGEAWEGANPWPPTAPGYEPFQL